MATREEILSKYEDDKEDKNVQLQTVLSSRIGQLAKENSAGINNTNVKIIGQIFTPIFSFHRSTPLIKSTIRRSNLAVKSELEKEFQRLAISDFENTDGEPDAYILVECRLYQQSSVKFQVTVEESVYLRLPGERSFSKIPGVLSFGRSESIVLSSESNGFEELKIKLSGISYPIESLVSNRRFEIYNQEVNINLENKKLPPIGPMPILVYSIFQLQDFSTIFPKPDGLDAPPSVPETPSVPTPPSVPETPSVPTPPSVPETPIVPDIPSTPTLPTDGKKYLSIEAIKKDDPVVKPTPPVSKIISVRRIEDSEVEDYYSRNELSTIKTETVSNKQGSLPDKPLGDKNPIVVSNEKKEKDKRTETQRLAEEADSLAKETPKEKSSTSVSGPNPGLKDGRAVQKDELSKPVPADKIPEKLEDKYNTEIDEFKSWVKKNPVKTGDTFIWNRVPTELPYPPNKQPDLSKDLTSPDRYKSLFDWGTSIKKFFSGYENKIKSPVDIALLCNTDTVGGFNKNAPYIFDEGSEIHLLFIRNGGYRTENEKGVIGKAIATKASKKDPVKLDANWAQNPYWCGLTVDFMLYNNTIYQSDETSLPIVGTGKIFEYFDNSPLNPDGGTESKKKKTLETINSEISSRKKTISSIESKLSRKGGLYDTKNRQLKELTELQADNLVQPSSRGRVSENSKLKTLENTERIIKTNEDAKSTLNNEILELETKRETIKNTPNSKYNVDGTVAKFEKGVHFTNTDGGLTREGLELWDKIKDWPGAYIVRRGAEGGHTELLLHFGKNGKLFVIFGNSGYGNNGPRNGTTLGFKSYDTIGNFGGNTIFIVKRGAKNPYTNGIGVSLKKTELYQEYTQRLKDGDKKLGIKKSGQGKYDNTFNLLREIMEI